MRYSLEWSQAAWCDAWVVISLAALVIVAATILAQRLVSGAWWRRGIWQAAFATLALLIAAEVSGLAAVVTWWLRLPAQATVAVPLPFFEGAPPEVESAIPTASTAA